MSFFAKEAEEFAWLHYYNKVLFEKQIITEEIYIKMEHLIENSRMQRQLRGLYFIGISILIDSFRKTI